MMMNLVKYWSRELLKLSICHALIIFPTSKKGEARNITSSFTFFIYLKSSFFPDSFDLMNRIKDKVLLLDKDSLAFADLAVGEFPVLTEVQADFFVAGGNPHVDEAL